MWQFICYMFDCINFVLFNIMFVFNSSAHDNEALNITMPNFATDGKMITYTI